MSLEQQMTDIESRVGRIESLIAILRDALINDRDSDKYDGCDNSVSADNLISHKFPAEYILDLYETLEGKLYDKYLSDKYITDYYLDDNYYNGKPRLSKDIVERIVKDRVDYLCKNAIV